MQVDFVTDDEEFKGALSRVLGIWGYSLRVWDYEGLAKAGPSDILLISWSLEKGLFSELKYLRRFWIARLSQYLPLIPAIILSPECLSFFLKVDQENSVVGSPGCFLLKVPFDLSSLRSCLKKAGSREYNPLHRNLVEPFLFPPERLQGLERGLLRHRAVNYLGPYTLLIGAYLCGEIGMEEYRRAREEIEASRKAGGRIPELLEEYLIYKGWREPPDLTFEGEGRRRLAELTRGKRILLVDDEYDIGWEVILRALCPEATLEVIGEPFGVTEEEVILKEEDRRKLDSDNDLILLDLRIYPAWDEKVNASREAHRLSGMMLLRQIRKEDPSVPVIMFTASNKSYNLGEAERWGIEGFFTKEEYRGEDEAKVHYQKFEQLMEKALSRRRRNLRQIWRGIREWEERSERDKSERKEIALRYLTTSYLLLQSERSAYDDVYARGSAFSLGMAMQEYGFYQPREKDTLFSLSWEKVCAILAYSIRGAAAHYRTFTYYDALFALRLFFEALDIHPELVPEGANEAVRFHDLVKWAERELTRFSSSKSDKLRDLWKNFQTALKKRNRSYLWSPLEQRIFQNQLLVEYVVFILLAQERGEDIPDDMVKLIYRAIHEHRWLLR